MAYSNHKYQNNQDQYFALVILQDLQGWETINFRFSFKFLQNYILNQQKIEAMGAVKSLTHSYTSNEYLLWHIQKNEISKLEQLLTTKPHLVNQNLSVNFKTTPLHRAATNGNLALVKLLIEKYQAKIDLQTSAGETALIGSVKRNRLDIVEYLLSKGSDTTTASNYGLSAIDYAVLQGLYEIALALYESPQSVTLKDAQEYREIGKKFKYRYVNFQLFLDTLNRKIRPQNAPDFLTKTQIKLEDPIVDPRQTWKQWFKRNMEFKDPPLVERNDLPEELQPQNRNFAGLRHVFTKLTLSPLSQSVSLKPRSQSEALSDCKMRQERESACKSVYVKSS